MANEDDIVQTILDEYIDKKLHNQFHDRLTDDIKKFLVNQSQDQGGIRLNLAVKNDVSNLNTNDMESARELLDKIESLYRYHQKQQVLNELKQKIAEHPEGTHVSRFSFFWPGKHKQEQAPESKLKNEQPAPSDSPKKRQG